MKQPKKPQCVGCASCCQPPATSCNCADQARPALKLFRTEVASRRVMREQDLAGSFGGRLMPENRERRIIWGVGRLVRAIRFEPNDKRVLVHNNPGDQLCEGAAIA